MSEPKPKTPGLWLEQIGPLVAGLVVLALLLWFSDFFAGKFAAKEWTSSGLYSAVFGWSAIQTGFAFGVYGFIIGKQDGFVHALRGTAMFERFESYIKRANWGGLALTFPCIPLIVTDPNIAEPLSTAYVIVAIWFAGFVWAFLAFCRLAYNFGAIASVRDKEFHGA